MPIAICTTFPPPINSLSVADGVEVLIPTLPEKNAVELNVEEELEINPASKYERPSASIEPVIIMSLDASITSVCPVVAVPNLE